MRKSDNGFTMLELLIAVSIFSVIAVALYSSFYAGIRIMRHSEDAMKFHQALRLAISEVSLDLRNSLQAELEEERGPVKKEESEEEPVYYFLGDGKSFSFVTLKDVFSGGRLRREICEVRYYLAGGDGGKLMRSARYQNKGFATASGEDEALISGIDDIEVLYSYENEDEDSPPVWLDYWKEEEKIPLGVKLKIKLRGAGALREITKTVFIETGALGVQGERVLLPGLTANEGSL